MTDPEPSPTPWQLAADEVLAACMADVTLWRFVRFEQQIMSYHFPPGMHRMAFMALDDLRHREEPTHLTSLVDAAAGAVPLEWWSQRLLLADAVSNRDQLRRNCDILRWRGKAYDNLETLKTAQALLVAATNDEERRRAVAHVINRLGIDASDTTLDASALAVAERFEKLLAEQPRDGLATQPDVQFMAGPIQRGEIWWIAAAYKMRKSSLMRNIVLHAARNGASATIVTLESPQAVVAAQIVTMLAAEWLLREGLYHQRAKSGQPLNAISPRQLFQMRSNYRTNLDKRQVAAIDHGLLELRRLEKRLRIYDATAQGGGVTTLSDVLTLLLHDRNLYNVDLLALDYLQRLSGRGDTIFDRVSQQALELQNMALRYDVALLVLAQLNEETIRGKSSNEHSPGVKGGGDPAATADYLFTVTYPLKGEGNAADRTRMAIELKLARHGEAGVRREVVIHPPSGLILTQAGAVKPLNLEL